MTDRRLEGRIALVTGAARGIGAAIARRYAEDGATVVLTDVNERQGEETAKAIGGSASFKRLDVGDYAEMERVFAEVVSERGRLDILVNNAGILQAGLITDLSLEKWERILHIDLTAVFYACRIAIPQMKKQRGGNIINMASVAGIRAHQMAPAYCAVKGAVVNFTRALALDHADDNIRVNSINPGSCETEFNAGSHGQPVIVQAYMDTIPVGRFGKASEVAAVAAFLASDDASYITGAAIPVDGGTTAKEGSPEFKRIAKSQGWLKDDVLASLDS